MRVSRSPKTARPRGYGYIEFSEKEVAEIAAESMNGYMMYGKTLECHVVENPHE